MRMKMGLEIDQVVGSQLEDLLTVGSKIFYQTHFYPLLKMQHSIREIYVVFKGQKNHLPVLLNVEVKQQADGIEILCGGMEITNRNKYEKELIATKKAAEIALAENAELVALKTELVEHQSILESQYRTLKSFKEQQQEVFNLIAHDLQEPLRKSIFMSNYIVSKNSELPEKLIEHLKKINGYIAEMDEMLLTFLRFKELENAIVANNTINLNDLVSNASQQLQLCNPKQLLINYPKKNITINGDERLLKLLFKELLRHSEKNRNPENEVLIITISAMETVQNSYLETADKYEYKKFVKISYSDNGFGFDSKLQKILQKSDGLNKVNIGLAYCKQIVEKHGGTMAVKKVKGEDVFYKILLPLAVCKRQEK